MMSPRKLCIVPLILLLELTYIPIRTNAKKRVVNYVPHQGAPPPGETPSQLPVYGGEKNMEEILNNPHFRYRKADLGDDPNIWGDALAAYETMLKFRDNQQADPNGSPIGLYQPGLFVPWVDVSDSFAAKRELSNPEDGGDERQKLRGRSGLGRQLANPSTTTTTDATTDNVTTTTTTTPTTTESTTTPRPTRPPLQCRSKPSPRPMTSAPGPSGTPQNQSDDSLYLTLKQRLLPTESMDKSVYDNCGKKNGKLCFGSELECIKNKNCRTLTTLRNLNVGGEERILITLLLTDRNMPSYPYIGLGFSPDAFVGDDTFFYCIDTKQAISGGNGEVALFMSRVDHAKKPHLQMTYPPFVSSVCMKSGFRDSRGILGCTFEVARVVELDDGTEVDLLENSKYYQYLAFGHYERKSDVDDPLYGELHNMEATWFTSDKVDIKKPQILRPRSQFLIYFHVWFAVAAFTFLMPSGSMIAKYGREVFNAQRKLACYKMPKWLLTHIRLNFISFLLIIASLFIILIDVQFTWQSVQFWPMLHSVIGLVAMLVLFPGTGATGWAFNFENSHSSVDVPKTRTRIMAWFHWGIGNFAYFAGIFCVVTAGRMQRALAPCMVEYFGWMHLVLHVGMLWLMTVDTWKLVKMIDGRYMFQRAILGPMIPWTHGEVPKVKRKDFSEAAVWKMRRRIVLFHFIASFLCTFAICVLMILPTVLCREEGASF